MAIDPSIPLQTQVAPIGNMLLQGFQAGSQMRQQRDEQPIRNQLMQADLAQAKQAQMQGAQRQFNDEQKSLMVGSAELKQAIDANDVEATRSILQRRQAAAKTLGLPDTHSAEGLQLLEQGGIDALRRPVEALYQAGLRSGVLQEPDTGRDYYRRRSLELQEQRLAGAADDRAAGRYLQQQQLAAQQAQQAEMAEIRRQQLAIQQQGADAATLRAGASAVPKPPTESQAKANAFAGEMEAALGDVDKALVEMGSPDKPATKPGIMSMIAGTLPGGNVARRLVSSPAEQKYYNGLRRLITAKLRADSGATITQSEIDEQLDQYMPKATDGDEVIAQKKQGLDVLLQSVRSRGTPQQNTAGSIDDLVNKYAD